MTELVFTEQQRAAIDRRDCSVLMRAGAGTGKTSVLVERFARAVVDDGVEVASILAITFTEKAAAQLKRRVRERLLRLGARGAAREAERAWTSTIHGFCSRLLRTHALTAGIDPEFKVLDALEAERLAIDAFDRALGSFLGDGTDPERLDFVAAYQPDALRSMVRTAYEWKRSRGERQPELAELDEPLPAGEREALGRAAAAALADLGLCVDPGKQVVEAMKRLEECGDLVEAGPYLPAGKAVDNVKLKGSAKALKSGPCDDYEEARAAFLNWCLRRDHWQTHRLLRELLRLFGERYQSAKRARSGLDFEDLQLLARDLLRDHAGLRERYAERFTHIMVDEFQDTNPLQNELLELLERDNLFRVGDENQSIYGFRHADVEVFREHHRAAAQANRATSVSVNFRSRGEILDAIDLGFERTFGEEFEPLLERPDSRTQAPLVDPPLEVLSVDRSPDRWKARFPGEETPFGETLRSTPLWRACEARLLARRVSELIAAGYAPGDIVLLLRATTHMGFYERALEERGIPTHLVGGRGYWGQQQVLDLRQWLGALANPMDELAIYSALASPLGGVSLDGLMVVRIHARRCHRDVWWTLTEALGGDGGEGLADALPAADRQRLERCVGILAAERELAPRISLETLIDRAVTRTGYDRRVLSLPAGDRRMANVRKLMRLAREYEADEGRDLRGFIDFVAERDLIQEREGEAPLEAEELDAVRLMTVHRAKGLEFKVVCVADLGKDGREDHGALRLSADGRVGLKLARLGSDRMDSPEMADLKQEAKESDEEEERRIFYVACTRAQEHLVLSGATDLEKLPEPRPLGEPLTWLWRAICPGLRDGGPCGIHVDEYGGRQVKVRWERCTAETLDELLPAADRIPAPPAPPDAPAEQTPSLELGTVPAPRALAVSRLSYSALAEYKRCSYRFYVGRALRLPKPDALRLGSDEEFGTDLPLELPAEEAEPRASDELTALLRGTIVHELLEDVDFVRPRVPDAGAVAAAIERHDAPVREDEVGDLRRLVAGFVDTPLRERLATASRVRRELPFAFTLKPPDAGGRSVLVNGVVDVIAQEKGGTLIVDYKSDRLDGRDPSDLIETEYATQRLVYALAALRAGAEHVEVTYVLLERPEAPVSARYEAADARDLEHDLLALAKGVVEGRFQPTSEPHLELCHDCPGRAALCSWDEKHTMEPRDR